MADNRGKRTAPSVQDVLNGGGSSRSKFKSSYTGPKKPSAPKGMSNTGVLPATGGYSGGYSSPVAARSGGILDYAWIAYVAILAIALISTILTYTFAGSKNKNGIYYPTNVFTISGVVNNIFDEYKRGGLGSGFNNAQSSSPAAAAADDATAAASAAPSDETAADPDDNSALLGETATSAAPNSTTGATMALDVGSSYGSYATATSHEQLLEQLDQALAANEADFVGMKLAYEDPESKALIGYPQSVVEHFVKYMSDNPDKRATFLAEVKDAGEYSAKNGSAYLLKLPLLQFTINMGYDGTTISISGFSDQTMDSGQSAVVSPLLPCMYTIHAETAKGSQTSEVECNMNEGNLKINIGVTN